MIRSDAGKQLGDALQVSLGDVGLTDAAEGLYECAEQGVVILEVTRSGIFEQDAALTYLKCAIGAGGEEAGVCGDLFGEAQKIGSRLAGGDNQGFVAPGDFVDDIVDGRIGDAEPRMTSLEIDPFGDADQESFLLESGKEFGCVFCIEATERLSEIHAAIFSARNDTPNLLVIGLLRHILYCFQVEIIHNFSDCKSTTFSGYGRKIGEENDDKAAFFDLRQ